ncbi:MAG: hypothetical protein DHS80DRAFT_30421 [Piptocephalis tieghemiana]|nr:MAG: hypothetical protein DHS80DRAFT_30421 [Piptocephalis tieghemiana]
MTRITSTILGVLSLALMAQSAPYGGYETENDYPTFSVYSRPGYTYQCGYYNFFLPVGQQCPEELDAKTTVLVCEKGRDQPGMEMVKVPLTTFCTHGFTPAYVDLEDKRYYEVGREKGVVEVKHSEEPSSAGYLEPESSSSTSENGTAPSPPLLRETKPDQRYSGSSVEDLSNRLHQLP